MVKCVHTPAHTKGHMCYLVDSAEPKVVFTGDCMFKGGCGKLFEVRGDLREYSNAGWGEGGQSLPRL